MLKEDVFISTSFIILLVASLIFAYTTYIYVEDSPEENQVTEAEGYKGTAEGFGGEMIVEVMVEDAEINDIKIIDHEETEDYAEPAFKQITENILNNQHTDVDVVSGSTVTSEAFIEAVEEALTSAEFNIKEEETDTIGGDGKFESKAEGYGGKINLEVILEDNKISDINIIEHSETDGIADPAFDELKEAVITNQSTDIDIVTGATVTSEAFIKAVEKALQQANKDF